MAIATTAMGICGYHTDYENNIDDDRDFHYDDDNENNTDEKRTK